MVIRLFICNQVKHCSPNVFFQKLRMEKACKMLNKTTETLDQIARECGYRNSSDFCRAFQKFFSTTPHTWRRRITPKQPFEDDAGIKDFNPGDKRQNGFFEVRPNHRARRAGKRLSLRS